MKQHAKGFSSIFECCICDAATCAAQTFLRKEPLRHVPCLHKHGFPHSFEWLTPVVLPGYLRLFLHFPLAIWHCCYFVFFLAHLPRHSPLARCGCSGSVVLSGIYCFWRQLLLFFHLQSQFHFLFGRCTLRVLSIFNSLFGEGIKLASHELWSWSWSWAKCQSKDRY